MKPKYLLNKIKPLAIVFLLLFSLNATAQKERLQTAFIYQLTRLIEWCPDGKQGNFVIGVVGNDPAFMSEIQALNARRVGNQAIEIKTFASAADVTSANIIYVTSAEFGNLRTIINATSNFCALIISDQSGGADKGAGVSIVYNEGVGKLELEINRSYMRKKSLNVSDQLYSIASRVY